MKKIFFLLMSIFLAGCVQVVVPAATDKDETKASQATAVIPAKSDDLDIYNKWKLPKGIIENNKTYFATAMASDCIKLENGNTEGGDLLSTLIIDLDARKLMNLNAYSPEYVLKLENKLVKAAHDKYNMDLYAFSVCHVNDNIDVVAGNLWQKDKPTIQADGKFEGVVDFDFGAKQTIAIVNGSSTTFFDGIQTRDNTATGAEVAPCGESLSKDGKSVLWSCFMGLHTNADGIDGSNMTEWTLPLDGGKTSKRDYVDYM